MKIISRLILFTVAAIPAFAHGEVINGIAAIVNDEPITVYEVKKEATVVIKEAEKKGGTLPSQKQASEAAVNRLVDKALVDQKIKELGIKVPEEEVRQAIEEIKKQNKLSQESLVSALTAQGLTFDQYRAQFKEQLERLRLMSQEVRSKIQVGIPEMQEYYAANPKQFGGDDLFHARQIFFKLGKDAPSTEIKKVMSKAVTVLNEARNGQDFKELAMKNSDDPRVASDGGDLGTFRKGDMLPEIEDAVARMNVGDISDLVISPAGLHIIKLEGRSAGKAKPFEEVKADIEEILYKKKSEERFNQWLADLRKSAAIDVKAGTGEQ